MQLKNIGGYYAVILDSTPTVKELINNILKEKGDQKGIIFLTPFDDSGEFEFINGQQCSFYKGKISLSNIDETVMNYHVINAISYFMDHHNTMNYEFEIESPNE